MEIKKNYIKLESLLHNITRLENNELLHAISFMGALIIAGIIFLVIIPNMYI
jgi:hypothetical protein